MAKTRVLITVTAYPLPSRSHDELVCTAGVLEDGRWIRIYPVPFQFLEFGKYRWVELDLISQDARRDFRPESHRPKHYDLSDLKVVGRLGTEQGWHLRKQACLTDVYDDLTKLIEDSHAPKNVSLAAFKPSRVARLIVEDDDREWKQEWREQLQQVNMFTSGRQSKEGERILIDKIPYKFKYEFEDKEGRSATMTIEDWEISALYRNCLANAEGDENTAIAKVREKYADDFLQNKELTLFLGTTLKHHRARHTNPFTIIGIFYPPRAPQEDLF